MAVDEGCSRFGAVLGGAGIDQQAGQPVIVRPPKRQFKSLANGLGRRGNRCRYRWKQVDRCLAVVARLGECGGGRLIHEEHRERTTNERDADRPAVAIAIDRWRAKRPAIESPAHQDCTDSKSLHADDGFDRLGDSEEHAWITIDSVVVTSTAVKFWKT